MAKETEVEKLKLQVRMLKEMIYIIVSETKPRNNDLYNRIVLADNKCNEKIQKTT